MTAEQACGRSLGLRVGGEGQHLRVWHSGVNEGVRAYAVAFPATGQGAVVLTNGSGGDAVIDAVIATLAEAHGWPADGRP